jgi:hypothetical protein
VIYKSSEDHFDNETSYLQDREDRVEFGIKKAMDLGFVSDGGLRLVFLNTLFLINN